MEDEILSEVKKIIQENIKPTRDFFRTPNGKSFNLTELAFSDFFVHKNRDKIRYNRENKVWYYWNGCKWINDDTKIMNLVKRTIYEMFNIGIREEGDDKTAFLRYCLKMQTHNSISNMLKLSSTNEMVSFSEIQFDDKPDLLICKNVSIDLSGKNFKIIEHNNKALIRKSTNVEYIENAGCEKFLKILNTIFKGDAELIEFIQRALGYSLTGRTSESCIFFLYGTGRNGKTTFIEILKLVFGEYYLKANIEMLMQKHSNDNSNDRATLKGSRFAVCSEIEQGKHFNESLVKDLTGGDDLSARFLYKEYFTFKPECKIWIYGNHKPLLKGFDLGIRRRIKLIPFIVTIPENELRPMHEILDEMRDELPGILNWVLEGFNKWKRSGLNEPQIIKVATEDYFLEMDLVGNFINEACIIKPELKITVKDLYNYFSNYCDDNKERRLSKKNFNQSLRNKGYETESGTANKQYWIGINKSEYETEGKLL